MEYRCLLKASLLKVYTSNYYKKKYAAWNSWAWLYSRLACGLGHFFVIGVKWHTPRFRLGRFIFQQKWKKNVFVQSKLICGVVQVVFTWLGSVGRGFRDRQLPSTPWQKLFFTALCDPKTSLKLSKQTQIYLLGGKNVMALCGVKQKVSQSQVRIKGFPGCLERRATCPALVTALHCDIRRNQSKT